VSGHRILDAKIAVQGGRTRKPVIVGGLTAARKKRQYGKKRQYERL
jgi:hypothetical protein